MADPSVRDALNTLRKYVTGDLDVISDADETEHAIAALAVVETALADKDRQIGEWVEHEAEYVARAVAAEAERDEIIANILDYMRSQITRDAKWQRDAYTKLIAHARGRSVLAGEETA